MGFTRADERKIENGVKELSKMNPLKREAIKIGVEFVSIFETNPTDRRLLERAREAFRRIKLKEVV